MLDSPDPERIFKGSVRRSSPWILLSAIPPPSFNIDVVESRLNYFTNIYTYISNKYCVDYRMRVR